MGGALVHGMWRENESDVATGVIPAQDRFRMIVTMGDFFFFVIFIWLLSWLLATWRQAAQNVS